MVSINIMNEQINVRLPRRLLTEARSYAKKHRYGTVQELMKETLREKVIEPDLTVKELSIIKKLSDQADKNNSWVSQKEVFAALK